MLSTAASGQGRTLLHFSPQHKHFLWETPKCFSIVQQDRWVITRRKPDTKRLIDKSGLDGADEWTSVSPWQWGAATFSHDGEFVVGASTGAPHELHIWTCPTGCLERILEGASDAKGITQITVGAYTRPLFSST
jgi:hypothetical protein